MSKVSGSETHNENIISGLLIEAAGYVQHVEAVREANLFSVTIEVAVTPSLAVC